MRIFLDMPRCYKTCRLCRSFPRLWLRAWAWWPLASFWTTFRSGRFSGELIIKFFLVYKPILVHALSLTKLLKNYIIILVKLYKNFYPLTKVKNSFALFEGLKMSYFMYLFQIFSLANVLWSKRKIAAHFWEQNINFNFFVIFRKWKLFPRALPNLPILGI